MFKKITVGFVVQNYKTVGGNHICVGQSFVAGDQVDYEAENGEPINMDEIDGKEQYQVMDMVTPKPIGTNGLKFTCPSCQSNSLECVQDGSHSCKILNIDPDGDFDYGDIDSNGDLIRVQCLNCGFALEEGGDDITDNLEVAEWVKENCAQPEGYVDPRYIDDNKDA